MTEIIVEKHTLLHHVTHWTARSKNVALFATTVFGAALCGGVNEKWTETPVASKSAIFNGADASETWVAIVADVERAAKVDEFM